MAQIALSRQKTDETVIADSLLQAFLDAPSVTVHAWHPPSAKTYFGPLVRIPRKSFGARTRDRYHLDGIVQIQNFLMLVELKGDSSGLATDVEKLKELMSAYDLRELKGLLESRVHDRSALATVNAWCPMFGYLRDKGSEPQTGVVVKMSDPGDRLIASIHDDVDPRLKKLLKVIFEP